jgi:hypothetical protein
MRAFECAEIGDRVWSFLNGWGEVVNILEDSAYPIVVDFRGGKMRMFTLDGKNLESDKYPELYWGEVKFTPPKPKVSDLPVDTEVIVWDDIKPDKKRKRYFSHFDAKGRICCFLGGKTSKICSGAVAWDNWELVEEPI